ncbi:MAG TPA: gliding motility-associated C-terminal domain-containing protein [Bacteroidales bacterium]|nr:gliding motility-associated C-terminal domain-containing protein [Bacteroidales bacterium]
MRLILSMLILLCFNSATLLSQKILSGNINQPKTHVVTIAADRVTVDNVTGFSAGDTILLIQTQGVKVLLTPYGNIQDKLGEPGMHEFMIISTVNAGNEIVFSRDILELYDPDGNIQIVRVPYYNSATVTGSTLFCDEWDPVTKSGGVLAVIIGRTLQLEADIDVSGKGFNGANDIIGDGICWWSDPDPYGLDYYPQTFTNAGLKGEGVANFTEFDQPLVPNYTKGLGPNWTGGGGGNARFSGGGGGSNRGDGGQGGPEDCFPALPGGTGGIKADHPTLLDRIYMGGGGGASTSLTGLSPSAGNGGGIVIIVTDTIIGNGGKIISNGGDGGTAVIDGGSGGGGGGGSIALSLNSYGSAPLEFSVSGGKGGDNPSSYGEGGGGGGGLVFVSTNTTGNVINSLNGGLPGNFPSDATVGGNGELKSGFKAVLNGFLFNSIRSSVTLNQVDSICSNVIIPKITGTIPVGGTPPYTYLWERSYDEIAWTTLTNDTDPTNYTPLVLETDTTYFRRTITDSSMPTNLVDVSKIVKIIVQTAITGNLVGKDTTICYNQNPLSLIPLNAGPLNGNGLYGYRWIENLTNTNWNSSADAAGTNDTPDYDPPSLFDTTYYRRVVTSGRCVDYSPSVTITVLPLITGNIIDRPDSVICEGSLFNDLSASATGGGDLAYKYQWQDSTDAGNWLPAIGINDALIYSADTSTFAVIENRYFRRVVYSGPDSVCRNNSSPIELIRYHKIENNSILADQTICSGDTPLLLSGSTPAQGSGVYTYQWQDSSKVSTWTTRGTTDFSFPPPALTDTTRYRRIVNSGIYNSAPVCADTSLSIRIDVHKPIVNNSISLLAGATDTTICNGAVPHQLDGVVASGGTDIPGDYAYQWFESTNLTVWNPVATAGTGITYDPPALTDTTYYRRQVITGTCTDESNIITITVLPLITNNIISVNQTVCYNFPPDLLTGAVLSGGAGAGTYSYLWEESANGTIWASATGNNSDLSGSYQPPVLTIPMKYQRIVKSGDFDCCIRASNIVDIGIYDLPTGTITTIADTTICEGSQVRLKISLTGASTWNIVYNENSTPTAVNNITGPDITLFANPVTGSARTSFIYSLVSVEDQNGCFAASPSGTRKADVCKVPVADAGPDATVCGPTVTLDATASYGAGIWYFPPEIVASTVNSPTKVTVTIDSTTFVDGHISYEFKWEETNWQCKSEDIVQITFDKRVSSINAGPDTTLFSFDNIIRMIADPEMDWETGIWTVISGTGDFSDDASNTTEISNLSKGHNKFLWTITNGTICKYEDMVSIDVYDIVIPKGFSPNNDPLEYNNTFIIKGLDLPNQYAELKVVNSAGAEVFSTSNLNSNTDWVDWDGKNSRGDDLPEGTYYYLLKLTSKGNGQVDKRSGFIILKRY